VRGDAQLFEEPVRRLVVGSTGFGLFILRLASK
jgi:hypothetical protein